MQQHRRVNVEQLQPLLNSNTLSIEPIGSSGGDYHDRNHLNIVNGVIVPCLLSILGVILFLRLGWSVGQAGIIGTFSIFAIAEIQALLTVLSLSALVSNGKMAGGGPYYLISRALGPELGGAIGVLFYVAYVIGAAFYVVGCSTEIVDSFFPDLANSPWAVTGVASIVLAAVLVVSLIGAGFFTKINILLFVAQFGGVIAALLSMWFSSPMKLKTYGDFVRPNLHTFWSNFWPNYSFSAQCADSKCTFGRVFAIIFPAATGIMEGANLSGDLDSPEHAIGRGTLLALLIALITYISLILSMAASFTRATLQKNMLVLQESCFSPPMVLTGVLLSTSSSALGAIFGGSRILHALAHDAIFPFLQVLSSGNQSREPRRAVLVTWILAQICVMIGDLDAIATLITSFFCLSYAAVNLSLALLRLSGAPNFRPAFRFQCWQSAVVGALLNISVMFWLNIWVATLAIAVLTCIFLYLLLSTSQPYWGGVSQALLYHQVRKYLLLLDERKDHAKLWRPSTLLLVDSLDSPLLEFCNSLKKGGLYVLGCCVVGTLEQRRNDCEKIRARFLEVIAERKLKAFPDISCGPSPQLGYQSLLQLSGIGALTPNTVVLQIPTHEEDVPEASLMSSSTASTHNMWHIMRGEDLASIIYNTLLLNKNTIVTSRHFESLCLRPTRIDVWIITHEPVSSWAPLQSTPLLLLHLSQILVSSRAWRSAKIHVKRLIWPEHIESDELIELHLFAENSRIRMQSIETIVVPDNLSFDDTDSESRIARCECLQKIIRRNCNDDKTAPGTRILFMSLPPVNKSDLEMKRSLQYTRSLHILIKDLPPVALVSSAGLAVMSRDI